MDMYNMDESMENKPRLELDARASKLQKLEQAQPGSSFRLSATARVVEIESKIGDDGMPKTITVLELEQLTIDDPDINMASVYPTMMQGA